MTLQGDDAMSPLGDEGKKRVRIVWSKEEDEVLKEVIAELGTSSWSRVATEFNARVSTIGVTRAIRNGKSCRIRWSNQLDASLNFDALTEEEEQFILKARRFLRCNQLLVVEFRSRYSRHPSAESP